MDTTRLQRPARVRIESAATVPGTRVYIDDIDVSNDVVAATWTVDANDRRPPTATITFIQAEISGEAELVEQGPEVEAGREFRAADLMVLNLKPHDTIILRTAEYINSAARDALMATAKTQFPNNKVMFLEGGLDFAILRQEPEVEPPTPGFATESDRERFAGMFGDRIDDWFTPEFAAYVRQGPQPVVPREHVANRDEPTEGGSR